MPDSTHPVTRTAPAKLNLALHVTGQRPDGFHLLDMLVSFTEFGDQLTFAPADDLSLEITGPFADELNADSPRPDDRNIGPDNLVLRAALALQEKLAAKEIPERQGKQTIKPTGAAISLQKYLPVSSGIGGGSADAAATLSGLNELWQGQFTTEELAPLALSLGADIPMCLAGKSARIRGIGEQIDPVSIPPFPVVLINPCQKLSTPAVFKALKRHDFPPLGRLPGSSFDWLGWLNNQRNDLEQPATTLVPSITTCLDALEQFDSCKLARMSGSGATCLGLIDTRQNAQRVAQTLKAEHPDWWVVATVTR